MFIVGMRALMMNMIDRDPCVEESRWSASVRQEASCIMTTVDRWLVRAIWVLVL